MDKKTVITRLFIGARCWNGLPLAIGSSFNAQRSVAEVFGWAASMKTASGLSWNSPFRYMTAWGFLMEVTRVEQRSDEVDANYLLFD